LYPLYKEKIFMKYELKNSQKGFTLIELMVALAIIAILILPLAGFLSGQLKRDENTIDSRLALNVAQQAMDRILSEEMPASGIKDDSLSVTANGKQWVVVVDPIDGQQTGEPANGTEPLEIRVRVYSRDAKKLMARLTALKGQ
jgi:type II secretion system protein I